MYYRHNSLLFPPLFKKKMNTFQIVSFIALLIVAIYLTFFDGKSTTTSTTTISHTHQQKCWIIGQSESTLKVNSEDMIRVHLGHERVYQQVSSFGYTDRIKADNHILVNKDGTLDFTIGKNLFTVYNCDLAPLLHSIKTKCNSFHFENDMLFFVHTDPVEFHTRIITRLNATIHTLKETYALTENAPLCQHLAQLIDKNNLIESTNINHVVSQLQYNAFVHFEEHHFNSDNYEESLWTRITHVFVHDDDEEDHDYKEEEHEYYHEEEEEEIELPHFEHDDGNDYEEDNYVEYYDAPDYEYY